jgi:glycosyltransferase 2 family protein
MKHGWHKHIIYISLIFLACSLYKAEYLKVPTVFYPLPLLSSFVLMFTGFIISAISQQRLLSVSGLQISVSHSLPMEGLNIFGKYIPGKMWVVMGKAFYISQHYNYSIPELSLLFIQAQIVTMWYGLALGVAGLLVNGEFHLLGLTGLILLMAFTIFIFPCFWHKKIENIINKLFKKQIRLPSLSIRDFFYLMPWFLGTWICWGLGFYLFAEGLSAQPIRYSVSFCFPLAGTLGIAFLFAPGGIGIRESLMVGFLVMTQIDISPAITISAASRLWFLIGEIFIFSVGLLVNQHFKKRKSRIAL